jgi:hypothetical protein
MRSAYDGSMKYMAGLHLCKITCVKLQSGIFTEISSVCVVTTCVLMAWKKSND